MDEVDGFVGGGDEDDDADDEDYAPGADTTTGAGGDDEAMASASSSEESESGAAADADEDEDEDDAEMDANTVGFSQSTSATTTLRDSTSLETVASASQPQPARRSDADDSDEEMIASQLVPPPRANGRKTARKVIMDDSDDDGAQGTQEHDSDAENRPPPAFDMEGDSDAENVPPATQNTSFATTTTTTSFFSPSPSARGFDGVLRSPTPVIAGTSPRRTPVGSPASQAQDKRSPLRRLKSFSSLTFSSPPPPPAMHSHLRSLSSSPFKKFGEDTGSSSGFGAMFRAGTAGEKGVFGSPAVTETDGEKPDARGEDDFGLGGMSQLFGGDSQTQSTGEVAKTSQRSQALRRSNSFDLSTQPTLLPAIQISDARRKMNDDILIGQQLDGIGSPSPQAQRKSQGSTFKPKPPPTFNFESQTWALPGASSFPSTNPTSKSSFTSIPMLDIAIKSPGFPSPTSRARAASSFPSNPLDDDDEEAEAGPSRRVRRGRASLKSSSPLQSPPRKNGRKRSTTPTSGARKGRSVLDSGSESGSPPPPQQQQKAVTKPQNAFSMLMSSKPGDSNKSKGKKPQVNREDVEAFMEQQAEESDEEIAFGFGVARRGGDDEDEEVAAEEEAGEDGHVKGLVDDQAMTDEQLAKEKVLEKVAEQHAEDEARRLKEAQDIADGQYRNGRRKRQRGLGDFDDSSDEEDETRRPKVEKKRKIKDDKMEGLAKLAKYNAFVNVYNNATRDEDDEYYENARSSSPIHALDDIYGRRQNTVDNANDDDAMDEDDVDDGASEGSVQKEEREIVTAAQLREEIRERAQKNKAEHDLDETPYDPTDLSWATKDFELEEDDMDDGAGFQTVQVVSSKPKPQVEPVNDEWTAMALEAESQREFPVTESQIRSYARNAVEYSNAGRKTAVTGGAGKPKPKPVASRGTVVREMKKATKNAVARSGSMLGRVTTRKQSSFMD
ncbi:hypothetical protein DL93DRAFT_2085380 [Clavulina sp. PMI_390]|nr:hypothetical protein DL93DRAFT_2085380 [Clavulina sp. PMI_390]